MRELAYRSTDHLEPGQRLRFWTDTLHEAVIEMDLAPRLRTDFFGTIHMCPLANLTPHVSEGPPQTIRRDRAHIARGNKNVYYLIAQARAGWRVRHAGRDEAVRPGDAVLVDSRIPYAFDFEAGLDDLSIELPVAWVEHWLPDPLQTIGRPIGATAAWGLALRGAMEAFAPAELAATPLPDTLLEDQLGSILALASGRQDAEPGDPALLDRCLQATRGALATPGLVAADIAVACGVSVRTLHRTFAVAGRTFGSVLMQLRIEQAGCLLADRRFRNLSVAEIARRCGFLDPSHFARQFRRQRGCGPGAFREAHLGP